MNKINIIFLLAGIVSMAFYSKGPKGKSVKKGGNEYKVEFCALKRLQSFADSGQEKTGFTIMTKSLGELKFDLKHESRGFLNGRAACYFGTVESSHKGSKGTAYLYSGSGGFQLGFNLSDSVNNSEHRYQIRNTAAMYDVTQKLDENPATSDGKVYTQSVRKEIRQLGIPSSCDSRIILEESTEYELIDISAMKKMYFDLNPTRLMSPANNGSSIRALNSNTLKEIERTNKINVILYLFNNNTFGEYSWNTLLDEQMTTLDCLRKTDNLNKMTFSFKFILINDKFGNKELFRRKNKTDFLDDWRIFHYNCLNNIRDLNKFGPPPYYKSEDKSVFHILCIGEELENDNTSYSIYSNGFGGDFGHFLNKGVISATPSIEEYTLAAALSDGLGAKTNDTVYTYMRPDNSLITKSQDLMRSMNVNGVNQVSLYHLEDSNIRLIQRNFRGY